MRYIGLDVAIRRRMDVELRRLYNAGWRRRTWATSMTTQRRRIRCRTPIAQSWPMCRPLDVCVKSVRRREIDVEFRRFWDDLRELCEWNVYDVHGVNATSTRYVEFRRRMSTNSGWSHRRRSFDGKAKK